MIGRDASQQKNISACPTACGSSCPTACGSSCPTAYASSTSFVILVSALDQQSSLSLESCPFFHRAAFLAPTACGSSCPTAYAASFVILVPALDQQSSLSLKSCHFFHRAALLALCEERLGVGCKHRMLSIPTSGTVHGTASLLRCPLRAILLLLGLSQLLVEEIADVDRLTGQGQDWAAGLN
jgi:hypothetical protein